MKKILIIRFSSIGDIVLTSPVVRCLKEQVVDCEIHFVTKAKYAYLVQHNPYINKVHLLKNDMNALISELKAESFDYVVDLHVNFRSIRVKNALSAKTLTFDKLTLKKLSLIKLKINILPDLHIVDRNIESVSQLGVVNDNKGLDFFVPPDQKFNVENLPSSFARGYIALVVGGTYSTKKLPLEKVQELIASIPHPIILLGGEEEEAIGNNLIDRFDNVLNFVGKISLLQSASLVEQSNLVIANDTGLMHIAAAYKKKMLVFWGNTVPAFGMYPYQTNQPLKMMEVESLKCRPCSRIGYQKCPKKHFNCMLNQDISTASKWIQEHF